MSSTTNVTATPGRMDIPSGVVTFHPDPTRVCPVPTLNQGAHPPPQTRAQRKAAQGEQITKDVEAAIARPANAVLRSLGRRYLSDDARRDRIAELCSFGIFSSIYYAAFVHWLWEIALPADRDELAAIRRKAWRLAFSRDGVNALSLLVDSLHVRREDSSDTVRAAENALGRIIAIKLGLDL